MAYNNGFPMNYGYYPNYQYQQPQNNSSLIWVSGEAGAKAYLVAPNTTVQLWDSEKNVVYIKSADASGMPSMKILDYTVRESEMTQKQTFTDKANNYATKDDIASLRAEMMRLIENNKGASDESTIQSDRAE